MGVLVLTAVMSSTASAALTIPSCLWLNQVYGFNYKDYVPSPLRYDCSFDAVHGNFNGPYANIFFGNQGVNTSIPCTSVSSRVTWGQNGTLVSSGRAYDTTVGSGWASAQGPSGYGVFGSRWWNTRPGVYDDFKDSFVKNFNC